jgi:hypothetical protein
MSLDTFRVERQGKWHEVALGSRYMTLAANGEHVIPTGRYELQLAHVSYAYGESPEVIEANVWHEVHRSLAMFGNVHYI